MKKIAVYSLVGLLILSCSVSPPNNTNRDTSSHSLQTPLLGGTGVGSAHSSLNFSDLEKEYKSFSTKALSEAYVSRMFTKFLVTTPNPTQVIRQLEFARYLKDVKLDTSYFDSLKTIIASDNSIYTKIISMPDVLAFMTANPATFGSFVDELSTSPTSTPANVILVKASATGTNNGTSWANAYTSLQDALTNATSGKDIWIATGTYKPGTLVSDSFQLKEGVNVYGGFTGNETTFTQRNFNTNIVILSGDINNSDTSDEGDSYHVVRGANNAILDGVTVKFGYSSGEYPDDKGGGMLNQNSYPTVTNVIFTNNSAIGGGAMYNENASPTITNVTFINNNSIGDNSFGGAMYNLSSSLTVTNVTFTNNSATGVSCGGGGMFNLFSSVTINNVTFTNNSASDGGGIFDNNSSSILNNVTFSNNHADLSGGGMHISDSTTTTLNNVTFDNNVSSDLSGRIYSESGYGGGMVISNASPTLTNVTFTGNSANAGGYGGGYGGGMYNTNTSSPTLTNVTFTGNSANASEFGGGYGGGMFNLYNSSPIVKNSIFWGNIASNGGFNIYNDDYNTSNPVILKLSYSDVEGGFSGIVNVGGSLVKDMSGTTTFDATSFGTVGHNISSDPLFVNISSPNGVDGIPRNSDDGLFLQSGSPARNTGINTDSPSTDITGASRPKGGITDMGAYEFFE